MLVVVQPSTESLRVINRALLFQSPIDRQRNRRNPSEFPESLTTIRIPEILVLLDECRHVLHGLNRKALSLGIVVIDLGETCCGVNVEYPPVPDIAAHLLGDAAQVHVVKQHMIGARLHGAAPAAPYAVHMTAPES